MKGILEATKLAVIASVLMATQAQAAVQAQEAVPRAQTTETVVHYAKSVVNVDVNANTVICSSADYSIPMLKILVPGLANLTLLDHQNRGAQAPCMTTGERCAFGSKAGPNPEDIIQGSAATESVGVLVTATRIEAIDHKSQTCAVTLKEHVETIIRGKKFFHDRFADLGVRDYADCASRATP